MPRSDLPRRAAAEALGTALLAAIVVGSGVMGERLAQGNVALALFANAAATGAGLAALVAALQPVSGAHFNPAVTLAVAGCGGLPWREVGVILVVQVLGAVVGVLLVHRMFELPLVSWSQHTRTGFGQWLSEGLATCALLTLLLLCARHRPTLVPATAGAFIAAGYWFLPSTCFANPALTLARAASDTFAGIRPIDAPGFIAAQLVGAMAATLLSRWLLDGTRSKSAAAEEGGSA